MKNFLFLLILFLFTGFGCVTVDEKTDSPGDEPEAVPKKENTITSLKIEDYSIKVGFSDFVDYQLYKPDDPFKVIVEMRDVSPGDFRGRTVSERDGISEVVISEKLIPHIMTVLEITMTSPGAVEHSTAGKELTLYIGKTGDIYGDNLNTGEEEETDDPLEAIILEDSGEGEKNGDTFEAISAEYSENVEERASSKGTEDGSSSATNIYNVNFVREPEAVRVSFLGNGHMIPEVFYYNNRLILDVRGVKIETPLPHEVAAPMEGLRWRSDENKATIVMDLRDGTEYKVVSGDNSVDVFLKHSDLDLISPVSDSLSLKKPVAKEEDDSVITSENMPAFKDGNYTGQKISLDFQDADIVPIFKLLTDVSGYNIVVDPSVSGKITMKLYDVPWDQALDIILKTHGLDKSVFGNIIRIAPASVFDKEREEKIRYLETAEKTEELINRIFHINYADPEEVKTFLTDANILSPRGNVSVDKRTGSLIIKDLKSNMTKIKELINRLDKATPQVLIEVRIVEVNEDFSHTFGIDWGFFTQSYDNRIGFGGTLTGLSGNNFLTDFPTSIGNAGTGLTLGFINTERTLGLDLRLSALESIGTGKVISNPRILTLDNESATFSQGRDIPYPAIDTESGTVTASFKDVSISIMVTPQVTPDNSILMSAQISKQDLIEFTTIGGSDTPVTSTLNTSTQVLINNGETLVLGGIFKKDERASESGYPVLKDLPAVGWMFKNQSRDTLSSEVLIFITPRIVN